MRKGIQFLACMCLLSSNHIAYSFDIFDTLKRQGAVEIETIASDESQPQTYIHFKCDDDLKRIRTSLDDDNPYVLLGEKEAQLFTDFDTVVGEHSIGSVAFATSVLRSGVRCIKHHLLENAREAMIVRLRDVEQNEKVEQLKDKLVSLAGAYVHTVLTLDIPGVGPQVKSLFICRGEENEYVVDNRFPAFNVIAAQLRPSQRITVKGKLRASRIRTNNVSPLNEAGRFIQNVSTDITVVGACVQDSLETNAAEVSKLHFVGELPLGDLPAVGAATAKGIKVFFDALPATGVYVKATVQGSEPGGNSLLVIEEIFFQKDNTFTIQTLDPVGVGTVTVAFVLDLPNCITVDLQGNLSDTDLTYKVIAENVNCIIPNERTL